MNSTTIIWRKSSHSGNNGGDCVEVVGLPPVIAVRDSKNPDGAKLAFSGRALGRVHRWDQGLMSEV